ncbi:hypothetical protein Kfla_5915 [Kribbella flavida DSM 17836]|uniref:Integral membrane protein n=1 Tax=Kribbella flavida (strain DSM 17836 / JCM 10339 / NBRC 14399) TaxID=479435 RepID=D2PRK1_KRIFD|nr:hypothetical protein [Kribbella flavida]ADB34919.1 hypothetical protein Kfla_5915 [Kribbella flavida DSM 17836]
MGTAADLLEYEHRFRRAGLPLFIEDFSPVHDIFTRATPLLALVFVAEMLGATSLTWPVWVNALAVLGGLAVLVGGFGLLNLLRGRPFWSLPTRFGIPELATFVLLPALLPLLSQFQLRQFFGVAAGNLVLLGLVYVVVGYGLIGTTLWGLRRLAGELASSVASLIRALPLLLVFSLVLFVNTEMWQVFAGMPVAFIVFSAIAFAVLSNLFLVLRLPQELDRVERDAGSGPPLRRMQRLNLSVSLVIRQWMQVLVVSAGVGVFFVGFGMLAISARIYADWGIDPGAWSYEFWLLGHPLLISEAMVKVAIGIANFTGLYYSISLMTDATYRTEFLDNVSDELRELFTARSEYLELRSRIAA